MVSIIVALVIGLFTFNVQAEVFDIVDVDDNVVGIVDIDICEIPVPLPLPTDDADGDGEIDSRDRCPGTPVGEEIDEAGCSLEQFCTNIDGTLRRGSVCDRSDWKNDEPTRVFGDCRERNDVCTVR